MRAEVLLVLALTALVGATACGGGSGDTSRGEYSDALLSAKEQADERFLEDFRQFCQLEIDISEEFLDHIEDLRGSSPAIQALHEEWVLTIEEELRARRTWCESVDEHDTWESLWEADPYGIDEYVELDEAIQKRAAACEALAEALQEERICRNVW